MDDIQNNMGKWFEVIDLAKCILFSKSFTGESDALAYCPCTLSFAPLKAKWNKLESALETQEVELKTLDLGISWRSSG